jgi:hypothetical protein
MISVFSSIYYMFTTGSRLLLINIYNNMQEQLTPKQQPDDQKRNLA